MCVLGSLDGSRLWGHVAGGGGARPDLLCPPCPLPQLHVKQVEALLHQEQQQCQRATAAAAKAAADLASLQAALSRAHAEIQSLERALQQAQREQEASGRRAAAALASRNSALVAAQAATRQASAASAAAGWLSSPAGNRPQAGTGAQLASPHRDAVPSHSPVRQQQQQQQQHETPGAPGMSSGSGLHAAALGAQGRPGPGGTAAGTATSPQAERLREKYEALKLKYIKQTLKYNELQQVVLSSTYGPAARVAAAAASHATLPHQGAPAAAMAAAQAPPATGGLAHGAHGGE